MRDSRIWLILLLGAILLGAMPFRGYDIGKLHPVQTIYARREGEMVIITADTADAGTGSTWEAALADMEQSSAGIVFQGTVEYVLLAQESLLREVMQDERLSGNCVVCAVRGEVTPEAAGQFLQAHTPDSLLDRLRQKPDQKLPILTWEEGRFALEAGEN